MPSGQEEWSHAGRPVDDAGARPGGAGDLAPQRIELIGPHPVLGIEQHHAVDALRRHGGERLRHGDAPNLDTRRRFPNATIKLLLQVERQRTAAARRIAAVEGLPGEIVVTKREAAGEPLEPRSQHSGNIASAGRQKLVILRRWDAEAEQRGGTAGQPAHQPLVEERRDLAVEKRAAP